MKYFFFVVLSFVLVSCSQNQNNNSDKSLKTDSVIPVEIPIIDATVFDQKNIDTLGYVMYYVTIADTGKDYFVLHKQMNEIALACKFSIDTLGKEFNTKKKKIALPENSDDEIYAGEYYPRRDISNTLSLEYLGFYYSKTTENTMALVTNICSEKDSAMYYAKKIPQTGHHVFVLKSNVFIGCMH